MSKTYIDEDGYLRFKDSDILVHRYVASKKLGRSLRKDEVVHHIDRNKLNNSPENLWIFKNQYEHDKAHKIDAIRHGKKASYQGFSRSEGSGCLVTLTLLLALIIIIIHISIII